MFISDPRCIGRRSQACTEGGVDSLDQEVNTYCVLIGVQSNGVFPSRVVQPGGFMRTGDSCLKCSVLTDYPFIIENSPFGPFLYNKRIFRLNGIFYTTNP